MVLKTERVYARVGADIAKASDTSFSRGCDTVPPDLWFSTFRSPRRPESPKFFNFGITRI